MKHFFFAAFLAITSLSGTVSHAQDCFDEIKNLPFDLPELSPSDPLEISEQIDLFYCFIGDQLDSIDLQLLTTGPMFASLYISAIGNTDQDDPHTYGDIYDLFVKSKKEIPDYPRMRSFCIESKKIDQLPALYANWSTVESFLSKLEMSNDEIEPLRNYLETNEDANKTIKDIRIEYQEARMKDYEQGGRTQMLLEQKEQFERLFRNSGAIDIESLIRKSLEDEKPILLYFTGYNCVNCRKIEESVLRNSPALDEFDKSFVFVSLYIDDRSKLAEDQRLVVNDQVQVAKTVGDVNMLIQISEFKVSTQPYFVALAPDGKILGSTDYIRARSHDDFMKFLNDVKRQWEKSN